MSAIDLGSRYEPIRELGSGGMGRVLLVRDLYLQRDVALKLLHPSLEASRELEPFQREFALLCEIEHPGVARAHDFGFQAGRPFFTSEYIEGSTLARQGRLAPGFPVLDLAVRVAEALAFLHARGVLHLDLKPSNIILSNGARQGPVLIDFGLFRKGLPGPPGLKIRGSLPYMAPEYFSDGPLTPRTDVYALGATLYRILTGAFARSGPGEASSRAGDEQAWNPAPQPPSEYGSCPAALDGVVLKCLALSPEMRFESAEALLEALQRAASPRAHRTGPDAAILSWMGRDAEIARLDRFIQGIKDPAHTPRALLVTAAPGMGQSHLLREMKVRSQTRGVEFYLETGYPGQSGSPGRLLGALGAKRDADSRTGSAMWDDFLTRLAKPRRSPPIEATEGERRLRRARAVGLAAAAIRRPMILAVDGLQHWDEISISLLLDLIRFLSEAPAAERPPIGVVAAYREEGTSIALLGELTAYLLGSGRSEVISLGPLGLEETRALFGARGNAKLEASDGMTLFQETRGIPSEIVAAARGFRGIASSDAGESSLPDITRLSRTARRILSTLRLLARPATPAELSWFTRIDARSIDKALLSLAAVELSGPVEALSRREWIATELAARLRSVATRKEEEAIHRGIAKALLQRARTDAALVEAVQHFRAAGCKREIVRQGPAAARYLRSTHQNRAAIDILGAVLQASPQRDSAARIETALMAAELHARIGELDNGIRILRDLLPRARKLRGAAHARTLLGLGCLHSRRGDFRRADVLFREVTEMSRGKGSLAMLEKLTLLNEHAGLKVIVGEHEEALRLCQEGLRLAGRSRKPALREAALNLHATRANVCLRTADLEGAVGSYVASLAIAEALGSPTNQAAILNNLGIVYNQSDRYTEAIAAFREAEATSLHLDEGPSLASIHGNLAVLHSKTGDFDAMERALEAGDRLIPGAIGRRQEFFLKHARGLSLINRGRYAEARPALEEAISMGMAMGDRHVAGYDEVYRAEALIFEGRYEEAGRELARLSAAGSPGRIRKMSLSRQAFLAALGGQEELLNSSLQMHARLDSERLIPFLDAWEALFLAWACSYVGRQEEAARRLMPAAAWFRDLGLRPAATLAAWILAESRVLDVRTAGAADEKQASDSFGEWHASNDLTAALGPLLEARRLMADAGSPGIRARCADLLAEAGAAMSGNPLPEWSLRLDALRALLRDDRAAAQSGVDARRQALARGIPQASRAAYVGSRNWKAWTGVAVPDATRAQGVELDPGTRTAELDARAGKGSHRARISARSRGMRKLTATLDRLRGKELPVLIRGEAGSGKELVARAIHEESGRKTGPFLVLDCATMPPALLESELFGARRGAFTGIDSDRAGMLATASGGTLFIDEIGGAPLEAQSKLLRVLAESRIRPLGAEEEVPIDVRFIFATSHDLEAEARSGSFRADLLYRIRVVTLDVPPLRDRPEDVEELVAAFLAEGGEQRPRVDPDAMDRLRAMPWPGNVRELRSFLSRLRVESPDRITADSIEKATVEPGTTSLFPKNLLARERLGALKQQLERDYIVYHHRRLGGDTEALREFLGVGRRQLYRRCALLGVTLRNVQRG